MYTVDNVRDITSHVNINKCIVKSLSTNRYKAPLRELLTKSSIGELLLNINVMKKLERNLLQ